MSVFDLIDRNRDGVLTRSELAMAFSVGPRDILPTHVPVTNRRQPVSGYVRQVQRSVFAVPTSPLKVSRHLTIPVSRDAGPTPEVSLLSAMKLDSEANQVTTSAFHGPQSSKGAVKPFTMESLLESFGTPRDTIDKEECDPNEGWNPPPSEDAEYGRKTPPMVAEVPTGADVCIDTHALHGALARKLSEQSCARTLLTDRDVHDVVTDQQSAADLSLDGAPEDQKQTAREASRTTSSDCVPCTSRDLFLGGAGAFGASAKAPGTGRWTTLCVSVPPSGADGCPDDVPAVQDASEMQEQSELVVSASSTGTDLHLGGARAVFDVSDVQKRNELDDGLSGRIAVGALPVTTQGSSLDGRSIEACEAEPQHLEPTRLEASPVNVCETSETRGLLAAHVPENFESSAPSTKTPVVLPLNEIHGHAESPTTVKRTLGKVITCRVKEVAPGPAVCVDLPVHVVLKVIADGPCNVEVSVGRAEPGSLPEAAVAA